MLCIAKYEPSNGNSVDFDDRYWGNDCNSGQGWIY